MSNHRINIRQFLPIAIICGILGGLLFVFTSSLPIKGYWSILTYIFVLITSTLYARFQNKLELNFWNTSLFGTMVFVIMTYVNTMHIYFIQYPDRAFFTKDSFLRFMVILAVGVFSSMLLAFLFSSKKARGNY